MLSDRQGQAVGSMATIPTRTCSTEAIALAAENANLILSTMSPATIKAYNTSLSMFFTILSSP